MGRKKTVDGETQPVSFRIGSVHKEKLARLAAYYELSQTDLIRKVLDTVYNAKFGKVKRAVQPEGQSESA